MSPAHDAHLALPRIATRRMPAGRAGGTHQWTFFRAGGVDQVRIQSGADLAHLGELDQKLWVALACPTRGTVFDERTLDLIDADDDGRIRAPELVAAAEWACARLQDPDWLVQPTAGLRRADLAERGPSGPALAAELAHLLARLDRTDDATLTLDDVQAQQKQLADWRFNGDGLISPAQADDPALAAVLQQAIATQGGAADAKGVASIGRSQAETFFEQARAQLAWWQRAQGQPELQPLGARTAAAIAALEAVRDKVDDYFTRCSVGRFDARAVPELNPALETYRQWTGQTLSLDAVALAALPLAEVAPGRPLPLGEGANPCWGRALRRLQLDTVAPLLDAGAEAPRAALAEADWLALVERLAPCANWMAARPDSALKNLPPDRLAQLADPAAEDAVLDLIARDEAVKPRQALVNDLERLLRYQRDLLALAHNFVSFEAFYHRSAAIFQAGTLYLDGRSCDLSVRVDDINQHAKLGGLAKAYLAYCECRREGQKMAIVAAFTAGDVDFLFVGRNGLFYDRRGRDWDATIVKLIENPISIGQAFMSPYKKFVRLIEAQVAKRAAVAESSAGDRLQQAAQRVGTADHSARPGSAAANAPATTPASVASTPAAARRSRFDVGTVAALGVALGSLSAVAVAVFANFIDLGWWIPVALLCMVLAISGPSMLIAWLKLRQRSLGPILDASGWAINGRMRINVRLGGALSQTAQVPAGAHRVPGDPFVERHGWAWLLGGLAVMLTVLLVAWRFALLNPLLPLPLRVPLEVRTVVQPDGSMVTVPVLPARVAAPAAPAVAPASAAAPRP